jgi:RNA polymerase sigma factor (sigma-70 family)
MQKRSCQPTFFPGGEEVNWCSSHIERALAGDAALTHTMIQELTPTVRRNVAYTLRRNGGNLSRLKHDKDDLAQEVFLALFCDNGRKLRCWQPERGLPLERFVALIARRYVLSSLRRVRSDTAMNELCGPDELDSLVEREQSTDEPGVAEARQTILRISSELQRRLSPLGVDVFHRLFVAEESVKEVSQGTGLSAGAVYQWRTRIRECVLVSSTSIGTRQA